MPLEAEIAEVPLEAEIPAVQPAIGAQEVLSATDAPAVPPAAAVVEVQTAVVAQDKNNMINNYNNYNKKNYSKRMAYEANKISYITYGPLQLKANVVLTVCIIYTSNK